MITRAQINPAANGLPLLTRSELAHITPGDVNGQVAASP